MRCEDFLDVRRFFTTPRARRVRDRDGDLGEGVRSHGRVGDRVALQSPAFPAQVILALCSIAIAMCSASIPSGSSR